MKVAEETSLGSAPRCPPSRNLALAWGVAYKRNMNKTSKYVPADGLQSDRFIEVARSLGCDEDEAHFVENLKKVARHRPPTAPPPPKKSKTEKPGK